VVKFKERDFEANQFNFRILPDGQNVIVDPYNLDAFLNQQNFQNGLFDIATFQRQSICSKCIRTSSLWWRAN
jgi:hypothetical protein